MVKAVILDVDGVIVGEKIGFNSPYPHKAVMELLRNVRKNGIPVILCTAKPYYAIAQIMQGAKLNNPHITDAGALIINPLDGNIIEKHIINPYEVKGVLDVCFMHNIYVEYYTPDAYYVIGKESDITQKHTHILQRKPVIMPRVPETTILSNVTKIMPIAWNEKDKIRVDDALGQFKGRLSISWGVHPVALPLQFGIVTAKESTKKEGMVRIIAYLHLALEDVLGIGDSTSDWQFISLCGYAATVENGSKELKELLQSKGKGKFFIGPSVDENGIVDIFKYFKVL